MLGAAFILVIFIACLFLFLGNGKNDGGGDSLIHWIVLSAALLILSMSVGIIKPGETGISTDIYGKFNEHRTGFALTNPLTYSSMDHYHFGSMTDDIPEIYVNDINGTDWTIKMLRVEFRINDPLSLKKSLKPLNEIKREIFETAIHSRVKPIYKEMTPKMAYFSGTNETVIDIMTTSEPNKYGIEIVHIYTDKLSITSPTDIDEQLKEEVELFAKIDLEVSRRKFQNEQHTTTLLAQENSQVLAKDQQNHLAELKSIEALVKIDIERAIFKFEEYKIKSATSGFDECQDKGTSEVTCLKRFELVLAFYNNGRSLKTPVIIPQPVSVVASAA
jgi:hypothetical protein